MMFMHGDINNRCYAGIKSLQALFFALLFLLLAMPVGASEISGVSLMDSEHGDVVRIQADSALEYQVFDLDGPPRIVVNFPGAAIAENVSPVRSQDGGVTSVFPVKADKGSRIEIGLSEMLEYNIEEADGAIVIRFAKAEMAGDAAANAAVLHDIEVRDVGSVTELVLRGEHMDASHNAFLTNNDQTLILDFWGASSNLAKEFYRYSTQRIRDVAIGAAEGRVRLVVGLLPGGDMNHQIDAATGQLVVRIGSVAPKRKAESILVENIAFQPDDRIAHVSITTGDVNPVVNISEKGDSVIIDLKKATLAGGQERSQDVRAFPGPVKQVDSYTIGDGVRIVARLRDKVDITSFQQGNVFTVNFEPEDLYLARTGAGEAKDEFAYSGQKVTFDFKDIDIRNALKLISEMSDLNIIMADDVSGLLTMRLVDVPWDQALDLILAARGLGQERTGNVMRIAPIEVLRAEYTSKLEARQGSEQLEPLVTEFITLSFSKVADVKAMLEGASANSTKGGNKKADAKGKGGGSSAETSVGILSPRGSFLIDERTNTLIIKDTQDAINGVKRLIATIDKPVEQVLIEGRIIEAKDTFEREFGISWGGTFTSNTGNAFPSTVDVTGAASGTNLVDLPAAVGTGSGGAVGIALGSLSGLINLDLELSAAEADGDAKIISNPRVVTTNLKPAFIKQGIQVAFVTPGGNNEPPTTELIEALLELQVTPQITAKNGVIMDIVVKKNSPTVDTTGAATGIDTKEVSTNIYMKNGETVVIGGVYTRDISDNTAGVPGMSDIPVLGWLFKKNKVTDNRSELLIFITPKILNTVGS